MILQPMHDGEAFHNHQTGIDNIKQTKRTNFYMPAPTKVHPGTGHTSDHPRMIHRLPANTNYISEINTAGNPTMQSRVSRIRRIHDALL